MAIAKWSNAPTVGDLNTDYLSAKHDTDAQVSRVEEWLDLLNITGPAKVKTPTGRSEIQPKLVRKLNEWRYPALTEPFMSTDDLFDVNPVTYEDKASSLQNALILNNQVSTKIGKVAFIDEYVRTGVDEGTVIVKTSWESEEEEEEVTKYKFTTTDDPKETQRMQELGKLSQEDPVKFKLKVPEHVRAAVQASIKTGVTVIPVPDGTEKKMKTVKNQPMWEVCDYRNVSIDPTCKGNLNNAEFVIHSFETSMSDLKKDGRYSNLDEIKYTDPLADGSFEADETSFRFKDEPRMKLVLHEYWGYWDVDGSGKTTPIVAAWVNNTLVRLEENPFSDGLPFVSVQMLPVRKSNYGEPDAELIADNQRVVGAVTRGMVDTMARSANGQIAYAKGTLDPTNKRKLKAGEDYEFNPGVHPDQAFHIHKFPELSQSVGLMIQSQISDAESLVGVRPFSQSQTGSIGADTAAGVKTANDATSKRDTAILRRFSQGIVELGRKTIAMNQQFLEEEEVIRITNEEFVTVNRDDLAGNFDLRISISTAEEDQAKAQELAFMMQTMGPDSSQEMRNLILSEIARLRKMPVLAKQLKEFQPQPDPIAQERAQLENELLKAQIQNEQGKFMENQSESQLDQAKTQEVIAKTRLMNSQADNADLDFVETETGTKHVRDLEKSSQQSKAQTETKLVEAQVRQEERERDHQLSREAAREDKYLDAVINKKQES